MIKRMNRRWALLGLALLAALLVIGTLLAEEGPTATASYVEGDVQANFGDGSWRALSTGEQIGSNGEVRTGSNARLELSLPDGSVLRIDANSEVSLQSLLSSNTSGGKTSMKVKAGRVWANVTKAVGGEKKFEAETKNSVAGVRGTVFRLDFTEEKGTIVGVYEGSVAVEGGPIPEAAVAPQGTKGGRTQVKGPSQISKKAWEEMVAKALQEVRVAIDGKMTMTDIKPEAEKGNTWIEWNQARDKALAENRPAAPATPAAPVPPTPAKP